MLRATMKSLLSRKLRLTLSALAVVLGVMFVSGAFVLTDTVGRSFNNLFADIYEFTDIEVSKPSDVGSLGGAPATANLPAADVDRVQAVPGVDKAIGLVFVDGARVIGKNGKVVTGAGGPRFGANWIGETELIAIRGDGRAPTADSEIAISANLAKATGYKVGDSVRVIPPLAGQGQPFTVVGITEYSGGRDSLAGEMTVFFNEPVAQRLMLGAPDVYNSIDVRVKDSANITEVRDRIKSTLGEGYNVKTGEQLTQESSDQLREGLAFFNYLLLGFASIALFVGVFLILNTFSIIVAQRTRELALFRAMGASRRQVIGSVFTEAVVIGTLASVVGLLLGIGVGALLGRLLGSALSGGALRLAGLAVPPAAIISAFVVGIGITVVAALLPALRASRIPPVAAMQDVATPDRPLTRLTVLGAAVLAVGGTLLGLGLAGQLGDGDLWGVLGGLLACFIGVALLTPLISRPVVAVLGRAFGRRASGTLGRRNSARNPRRTAITAAALMVGIAIITGISVIFSSIRESTVKAVDQGINAELAISGDAFAASIPAFDPKTMQEIRNLSDVESAVGFYGDLGKIGTNDEFLLAADDLPAALPMFEMDQTAGILSPLESGHVIVDDKTAADRGLVVGSTITATMSRSGQRTYTVQGIYSRTAVNNGFFFALQDAVGGFRSPTLLQGYVKLKPGADVDAAKNQVDQLLRDSPEVNVAKVDDFVAQQAQVFDFVLIFVQLLLGLAMIIAVLGIINTLALSTFERTRELGLLRAVGMKQGQVMWMVTVESVVISVFGAILGIVVGAGLGVAVFQALREEGFTDLAFPWPLMAGYLIASVFVGLAAALIPAVRAARLDVLKAIAYE
jgi:putative ABC transport system permease protein